MRLIVEMVIGVCLSLGTVFGRIGVPDDKLAPILSTDVRYRRKLHGLSDTFSVRMVLPVGGRLS
ncbi:hypothetical protein, partial [Frankia sp. Cr1]|uniref:hypothetical protein n=1 Tax=Frankia sp. Cr1 TaxID=3073931 RepID=UPI002AD332DE